MGVYIAHKALVLVHDGVAGQDRTVEQFTDDPISLAIELTDSPR